VSEFQAILLEGLFYTSDSPYPDAKGEVRAGFNDLMVRRDTGSPVSVYDTLLPLVGERIQFSTHHLPSMPPDINRWGGGPCFWEDVGHCPFGHHETPGRLFNIAGEGILSYDLNHATGSGGWWLDKFDGTRTMLPLSWALVGHRGRVAAATTLSVEQMRESLLSSGRGGDIEALGAKITDLRDLMEQLSKTMGGD